MMRTKILLIFAATMLATLSVFAQTPKVVTLKAANVSSTDSPQSISAKLNGVVNAMGTNCTVSFEYGLTTSYGDSIVANPGNVIGNDDNLVNANVTLNYVDIGQDKVLHFRLKVVNGNGTYYGRDFVASPQFLMRDVGIFATCSDSYTMANYDLVNNSNTDVYLNYVSGTYSGTVTIGSHQTQQIFVAKSAFCNFSYHYTLTRQIYTNDQFCSDQPAAWTKVFVTAVGTVGPGTQSQLFKVENFNMAAVTLQVTNGSEIYTQVVPGKTVMYFAGAFAEAMFTCDGIDFAVASPTVHQYEGMGWLAVNALSSTSAYAGFELYNRDDAPHTFVLINSGGSEYSYTLSPYEARNITLTNENWDICTSVTDFTQLFAPASFYPATSQTFGSTSLCRNGYLKLASAVPAPVTALNPIITSITPDSFTSFTANGTISSNPLQDETVNYYFKYGTAPDSLNLSTTIQQITVYSTADANVTTTISGLPTDQAYYVSLVANTSESSPNNIYLSSIPTANLKLRLRADKGVTISGPGVSLWNNLVDNINNASQSIDIFSPALIGNSINGQPAVRFNGTNSYLELPYSYTLGIQNNPYEMFIVAKTSSGNIQFLIAGGAMEQFEYHLGSDGARFIPITSTYLDAGIPGEYTDGNAHIFSARASATGGAIRVDGIDGDTSTSNLLSANSSRLLLGSRFGGSYYFAGDIAEVIIYNNVLSASDRDSVEQYLFNRYFSYNISASVLPANSGTITGEGTYNHGSQVTMSATPEAGYTFINWTENGTEVSNNPTYSFTASENRVLVANFELSTSINKGNDPNNLKVYPNPFSNILIIESENKADKFNFEISNAFGQVVYKGNLVENTIVHTNSLASGIYLIKLVNGKTIEFKKIMKE